MQQLSNFRESEQSISGYNNNGVLRIVKRISLLNFLITFILYIGSCTSCASNSNSYYYTSHTLIEVSRFSDFTPIIPVYIDGGFDAEENLQIREAIAAWNYALNGYLKFIIHSRSLTLEEMRGITTSGGYVILNIGGNSSLLHDLKNPERTWGYASCVGCHMIALVGERIPRGYLMGVTLHEIGHLLGASHGTGLMYPYAESIHQFECIDYEVIKQVALHWQLPLDRLNYCIKM